MKKDELLELVVALTAKNIALEEQIKSYERGLQHVNEYEDDSDYYPPHPGYVPGDPVGEELRELIEGDDDDSDWNYPNHYSDPKSVEVDLLHKINALETKVVDLGQSIWERVSELEQRVHMFDLDYAQIKSNKSKIKELANLEDKVDELDGYYKMCLKVLIDDDKQFNLE